MNICNKCIKCVIIIIIIIIINIGERAIHKRQDRVCVVLHFNICKEIEVKSDNEQWCDRVPKLVERSH